MDAMNYQIRICVMNDPHIKNEHLSAFPGHRILPRHTLICVLPRNLNRSNTEKATTDLLCVVILFTHVIEKLRRIGGGAKFVRQRV